MPAIRRQINIAVAPRAVWRALTTVEGLTTWLADDARIDARVGGRIVLTSEDDEGNPLEECGIIHEIRPIRRLEIAWDASGPGKSAGSRLEFQVARDGEETRLSLVQRGGPLVDDEEDRAQADRTWRQAFLALRSSLEGE
ncbi:MAG: SRPBCC domain-containing protein [Deltaproteobacteria bacterium]|nr:SRPBCC domain-containing protein [Deltaproteobacteria bacterium]